MRSTYTLIFVLMLASVPFATYLAIIGPLNSTVTQGASVYLGKVGPGESFYVLASASTVNASGTPVNIGWDRLEAINLPSGWSAQRSSLYENPMKMKITVSPGSENGKYAITLRAVNVGNYSRLGNLTFTAYVNVTPDVFSIRVNPTNITTGVAQPANLHIYINNTGISDDPFTISVANLPAWNLSYSVISLHGRQTKVVYPVYINEPGLYVFNITVASSSSLLMGKTYSIRMLSEATLLNDYSAIGQGIVLSPLIYEPAYSVMLFIDELYKTVLK